MNNSNLPPFHKVLNADKKELLNWLTVTFNNLSDEATERTGTQKDNLLLYRGVTQQSLVKQFAPQGELNYRRLQKFQKFVVNHLYDLTETKISQMTRLKPAVQILPTNDEWRDRAASKVVKAVIDHLWYINNIDDLIIKMHRHAKIFGESYLFITWNKELGDLTPEYVAARESGSELPEKMMTGDVEYSIELPWRVFLQRKADIKDVDYLFRVKFEEVSKLKEEYKNADLRKADQNISFFDVEDLQTKFIENHVLCIEFFHKQTKLVPEGAHIKFLLSDILEKEELKYTSGLPFVRLTDLDVPEQLNGASRYETVGNIQQMYNNISTLIAKNIYLTAHAKWAIPAGACKVEHLGNDNTMVTYKGGVAPHLIQVAPNPAEVYSFREMLKQEMQVIYGSHGISRGEIPAGITAASALQYLNELESARATSDISKHGFLIKDITKKTIATAGDFYESEDGRMIRIVGENDKYLIKQFDTAHLSKDYDVRVDTSSVLPETKAGKRQLILDMMQRNPSLFTPEKWEQLLDLGDLDKAQKLAAIAISAAESENEDLLAGRDVAMPEIWEDHISHWNEHFKVIQSRQFKEEADEVSQAKMKDHLYWTEEAMLDKAQTNPEFSAALATLLHFPVFKHSGYAAPVSREQQIAMVQGQTNRGAPVTGVIPGTDTDTILAQQNALKSIK